MESSQISKLEETKLVLWRKSGSITVSDCVTNQTLSSYSPKEQESISKVISATIAKIFYAEGHPVELERIELLTELFIEDRRYESPETLIKGLGLIAQSRYGKFYGMPGISEIQEKFATFLQNDIIPAREQLRTEATHGGSKERNKTTKGIEPIQQVFSSITKESEHKAGKQRTL